MQLPKRAFLLAIAAASLATFIWNAALGQARSSRQITPQLAGAGTEGPTEIWCSSLALYLRIIQRPGSAEDATDALLALIQQTRNALIAFDLNKTTPKDHQTIVDDEIVALEQFVTDHPASAWSPSILAGLAHHYRWRGAYTRALKYWNEVWNETRGLSDPGGKAVADFTISHWTRLLASLGRVDDLEPLFASIRDRVLDQGELSQRLARTREAVAGMRSRPGRAFKCGAYALNNASRTLTGENVQAVLERESPATGFTVDQLQSLSDTFALGFQAVYREPGTGIIVPSVVHWKQEHYAAIIGVEDGLFKVMDPTFEGELLMTEEQLNEEASGIFLIPAGPMPPGWRFLTVGERQSTRGRGYP